MIEIKQVYPTRDPAAAEALIALSERWEQEGCTFGLRKNDTDDLREPCFAAFDGGRLVGYGFGHFYTQRRALSCIEAGSRCFELDELYVLPEYRSRGLGGKLFRALEAEAAPAASYLTLSTATKDFARVLRFYTEAQDMTFHDAFLFKPTGTRPCPPERPEVCVRLAREEDLPAVNRLRRQVNELHVKGKPEVFKPGFCAELEDWLYEVFRDPERDVVVAERNGAVCGFAFLHAVCRPETPYMYERRYLDVEEFCVDDACRRQGVGTALAAFIRALAKERGFDRVELNMWEFNDGALAFYEAAGFTTYRRYMEITL